MAISGFDPISAGVSGLVGLGLDLYGMTQYNAAAGQYNQAQVGQIRTEQQMNQQRKQFMELDNRRKQLEALRQAQRARSIGLSDASNQGASFGSGLQGGFAQVMGHEAFNAAGLSQSKEIGENLFSLTDKQSQYKIQQANAQYDMGTAQGLTSLGNSFIGSMGTVGQIF